MSSIPTQKILAIISERIASGLGERDDTDTLDTYDGVVVAGNCAYNTRCAWPDGTEAGSDSVVLSCEPIDGDLIDSDTGGWIRKATQAEVAESHEAGPEGHIRV